MHFSASALASKNLLNATNSRINMVCTLKSLEHWWQNRLLVCNQTYGLKLIVIELFNLF